MRHKWNSVGLLLLSILLIFLSNVNAQETSRVRFNKVAPGDFSVGLFGPLQYGVSAKMTLETHPVFDFLIPNATLIWSHGEAPDHRIESVHTVVYPTLLLRLISRKGTGGVLPDDPTIPEIPFMAGLYNEVRYYRIPFPTLEYYFSGGVGLAGVFDDLDERTTIDLPVVFPRLGVYYNGYSVSLGSGVAWELSHKWGITSRTELIWLPGYSEDFFWEHRGQLYWQFSSSWNLMGGYLITFGRYPFGKQYHLLPMFDVGFQW